MEVKYNCDLCNDEGVITTGEFDNIEEVKCICKVEADKDNEVQNEQ